MSLREAERLRDRAMKLPFTVMAFVTAKGRGVKLICRTSGDPTELSGEALRDLHKRYYEALARYYEKHLGCAVDRSGNDVTCTVLFSYDKEARSIDSPHLFGNGTLGVDVFFPYIFLGGGRKRQKGGHRACRWRIQRQ